MGEAEDAIARQRAGELASMQARHKTRYDACMAEIRLLAPRAAANLKKRGYPERNRIDVNFKGERRVAWTLHHDGWGGYLKIDLLADGTIVKNDGSSHSDRIAFIPLQTVVEPDVEAMEEVVSSLRHLATSDFKY